MKKYWIGLVMSFLLGATVLYLAQTIAGKAEATSTGATASGPKRILVPFMHMRGFGGGAGHQSKSGKGRSAQAPRSRYGTPMRKSRSR